MPDPSTVLNIIKGALGVARLDEDSEYLPRSMSGLKGQMETALSSGADRYGTSKSPESDRYRHVIGMRNAALDPEVGGGMAFLGGLGHEVNNLYKSIAEGDLSQLGTGATRLGIMQILENSSDDVVNNFIGILSAYRNPEELSEDELIELLERATLPRDIRRPDDSAVMVDQDAGE